MQEKWWVKQDLDLFIFIYSFLFKSQREPFNDKALISHGAQVAKSHNKSTKLQQQNTLKTWLKNKD